jgi:hypothetical protein
MKRVILFLSLLMPFLVVCALERSGIGTPETIDTEGRFRGCFQRSSGDHNGRIIIIPDDSNQLLGTGFGLYALPAVGWTFTGRVTAAGIATLHITPEEGPQLDVEATRLSTTEQLILNRRGFPSLNLSPCT